MSKTDEAILAFQQALRLRPDYAAAHCNLGNAFKDAGRLGDAIECYRRAVDFQPRDSISHSNLIFTMQYHPDCTANDILREALRWNALHAQRVSSEIRPHENDRNPDRKLRIGYVGADFRDHCQSFFTIPLFANHGRENFEIFCYSHVALRDAATERIEKLVDRYEPIIGISDKAVAGKIREDRIDILVDLTMHMSHGRSLVFAASQRPCKWRGWHIQGRRGCRLWITASAIPISIRPAKSIFTAKKPCGCRRLSGATTRAAVDVEPGPLPAIRNGFFTFGCLNNFCKVTVRTLDLWMPIFKSVGEFRLLLLAANGGHRERIRQKLSENGINPDWVEFIEFQQRRNYLELYRRIDIGLDTLPYNGHTTSLDSFWMGVPVVSRIGSTVVGRAGLSQLSNLNLKHFAAETDEQFHGIVLELCRDAARLADLRRNLRRG